MATLTSLAELPRKLACLTQQLDELDTVSICALQRLDGTSTTACNSSGLTRTELPM